jgi:hypothetical protein
MAPNQLEDQSTEIIADIQNLQNIENDLFKTLETGLTNKTLTADQQTNIVDQINKVSSMRASLFKTLNNSQKYYQGTVSSVGGIIGHQINALAVVENQLNESKKRLKIIEEEKNNKLRLVEINTYYGEKYANHTGIMKTVVFFCIPIIILAVLANANILPHSIYVFLFILVVVVAIVIIWRQILDALSRDNMVYDEYVWGKEPPEKPEVNLDMNGVVDPWKGIGLTCVAQECCDTGYTYVPSPTNKCISNSQLPAGINPYNPSAAQSVSSGAASATDSTSGSFNPFDALGSAASSATNYATGSVASAYDSLANL